MTRQSLVGKCYYITIDGKKVLNGWFLIITPDGSNYLVERGSSWTFNIFRKVYKSDYDFSKQIVSHSSTKQVTSVSMTILLGIGLVRAFPSALILNFFFGKELESPSIIYGLVNMTLLYTTIIVFTRVLKYWRRHRLNRFLSQHGERLHETGQIRLSKAIKKIKSGAELW